MANHVRDQLREAVAALLTGLSITGPRVFQSRIYPLQDSELPCLLISTEEETNEYLTTALPRRTQKRITLSVKALVKATSDLDATLDAICKEVEIQLAMDPFMAGFAKNTKLLATTLGLHGAGEQPIGVAVMLFEVDIHTRETTPDVAA